MARLAAVLWRRVEIIILVGLATLLAYLLLLDGRETVEEIEAGTGYPVAGEFRSFYEEYGGAEVFGYPLTESFEGPKDGRLLQYFQNVRLEYDTSDRQVIIADLGLWALPTPEKQVLAPDDGGAAGRLFDETGITVRGEFLTFYDGMAGEILLGSPISAELNEAGIRAQYFEKGRLEWHPELTLNRRVQLGPLGNAHFKREGSSIYPVVRNAIQSRSIAVRDVSVEVVFWAPILYGGDEQVAFVNVVRPDDGQPVRDMRLKAEITYDGQSHSAILPVTDEAGRSQARLNLDGVEPGQKVLMTITAERPDGLVVGQGASSFRTWW